MDADKQEIPKPIPVKPISKELLRGDLQGLTTSDVSPNCPKKADRKTNGECGVCLKLPGGLVQCEFCGQIFKP